MSSKKSRASIANTKAKYVAAERNRQQYLNDLELFRAMKHAKSVAKQNEQSQTALTLFLVYLVLSSNIEKINAINTNRQSSSKHGNKPSLSNDDQITDVYIDAISDGSQFGVVEKPIYTPTKNHELNNEIQKTCTQPPIGFFNKPAFRLDALNEKFIPESTFKDLTKAQEELDQFEHFTYDPEIYNKIRDKKRDFYINLFYRPFYNHVQQVCGKLSDLETKIFDQFSSLQYELLSVEYAHKYSTGKCGEHKAMAIIKLLELQLKFNTEFSIQEIKVSSANRNLRYQDHMFLVINSGIDDIEIKNNPARVKKILHQLDGMICDPWNSGFYERSKDNKNGLYRDGITWENIRIITHSNNYKDLQRVSDKFRLIMCDAINQLYEGIRPRTKCTPSPSSP